MPNENLLNVAAHIKPVQARHPIPGTLPLPLNTTGVLTPLSAALTLYLTSHPIPHALPLPPSLLQSIATFMRNNSHSLCNQAKQSRRMQSDTLATGRKQSPEKRTHFFKIETIRPPVSLYVQKILAVWTKRHNIFRSYYIVITRHNST
jgi:hypothetical protein